MLANGPCRCVGKMTLQGGRQSQGWDYQLKNEPILNLAYEYRHKFRLAGRPNGWAIEAIPGAGGWLGNFLTQGQVGADCLERDTTFRTIPAQH